MRIENSFIPVRGVGEKTERKLWRAGSTHWDAFDPSVVGSTTGERIEAFIAEARERLAANDPDFFAEALPSDARWRLYENFRTEACFLDIETTGLDAAYADVTTISLHQADRTRTLVRGEDLTADALAAALDDAALLVTFNGARFDLPFLETAFDLSIDRPHVDLMYPCKRLGLTGGLKSIEEEVGIARDSEGVSGRDAVRLWHAYERGDDAALDRLVRYNRDDTENLRPLMDLVADRLHREVFAGIDGGADALSGER